MRIAAALPEVDSSGRRAARPVVSGDERGRVQEFLSGGLWILRSPGRTLDEVDPARGKVVPQMSLTDGEWIWPLACMYYLRVHGVGL